VPAPSDASRSSARLSRKVATSRATACALSMIWTESPRRARASASIPGTRSARERLERATRGKTRHVALGPTLLGERDEQGRGLPVRLDARRARGERTRVRSRSDGARGGEHADLEDACGLGGGSRAGLDDAQHRKIELHAQALGGDGAHRVAGDDDGLHPARHQVIRARERVARHGGRPLRPVGDASGVAEVDDVLVRKRLAERAYHGEPAQPRVEHTERRRAAAQRSRGPLAACRGDPAQRHEGGAPRSRSSTAMRTATPAST
jgi:hypothetical protein